MSAGIPVSPLLPSPPFIDVQGIANFRDIGGYATSGSASINTSIRRHLVFRCADPSRVQPDGLAKLRELKVKKVFDLRSLPEIERRGPEWSGVEIDQGAFVTREEGTEQPIKEDEIERVWTPVFANKDYGPEQMAIRYKQYANEGTEVAFHHFLSNATKKQPKVQ